jgi:hypothetical protein
MAGFFDSLGDAFLAGEIIGFIEDNTRECRRCGGEVAFDEEGFEEYLCPRCLEEEYYDEDLDEEDEEGGDFEDNW